ncbi:hypothetical protein QTG56_07140 [Rossellomorea sp. AcN35-11]|nr:hypothetical protein [Rossellomorea aquimaris]WJV30793.1 hypothetical protein QTG56_07140 [Rossellomorea sp. AcN35-11]
MMALVYLGVARIMHDGPLSKTIQLFVIDDCRRDLVFKENSTRKINSLDLGLINQIRD